MVFPQEGKLQYTKINQPKFFTQKISGRKLGSVVNWRGRLKQKKKRKDTVVEQGLDVSLVVSLNGKNQIEVSGKELQTLTA
jgi:hypothetical protein